MVNFSYYFSSFSLMNPELRVMFYSVAAARQAFLTRMNIISDMTNETAEKRRKWVSVAEEFGASMDAIVLDTSQSVSEINLPLHIREQLTRFLIDLSPTNHKILHKDLRR